MLTRMMMITLNSKNILLTRQAVSFNSSDDLSNVNISLSSPFSSNGSPIEFYKNVTIGLSDIEFNNVFNNKSGGSYRYVDPLQTIYTNNTLFNNSHSRSEGGSMYFDTYALVFITNCSYANSSSVSKGGSLSVKTLSNFSLTDSNFGRSISGDIGGSVFIDSPYAYITKNWFEMTNSSNNGGCISVLASLNQKYYINDCYFGFCISINGYGGAIFVQTTVASYVSVIGSTFFSCKSATGGGAIYLTTTGTALSIELLKLCISQCHLLLSSSSYLGSAIYFSAGTMDCLSTFQHLSLFNNGLISYSTGMIYAFKNQHNFLAINSTKCIGLSYGFAYFRNLYYGLYRYFNIISTVSQECVYFSSETSDFSIDFEHSNIINNTCSSINIRAHHPSSKFTIKNCILINNSNYLLYGSGGTQMAKNCYIIHTGSFFRSFTTEAIINTTINTETILITHYSTYLCITPLELGVLEIPCQTIPDVDPCQTLPVPQTTCLLVTHEGGFSLNSLSTVLHLALSSLINTY